MPESQTPVAVALLYQTNQHGGHLREALKELGAAVVYEALTADIDRDKLEGSGARVVVVNLDPDTEALIDHVYDLLDEGDYQVVFNEAQVSANLSGWDHARWARNLAAKILKRPEIAEPPRPPGAEAVPTPMPTSASSVAVANKPGERAGTPGVVMPAPPGPSKLPTAEMRSPKFVRDEPPQPARPDAVALDIASLGQFATTGTPTPPEPVPVVMAHATSDFAAELDALFAAADAAQQATTESNISLPSDFDLADMPTDLSRASAQDFESIDIPYDLGAEQPPAARIAAVDTPADTHAEFPAIFDQLDTAAAAIPEAIHGTFKTGRRKPAPAENTGPVLPPEWDLEPFQDETTAGPVPTGPAKFGVERVTAADYLAPHVEAPGARQQMPATPANGLSLELIPMEEAVAQQTYQNPAPANEVWLDGSRPEPKRLKVGTGTGVDRVFVLGASIGGPEAVRDFLGTLPAGFPALFVLVQHMGEEFLELMSAQLAKAVALTVRNPTHGERVGHGEIMVVPTTHRLQVDAEGVVTLAQLPGKTPYSPSIDLVLRDVADQFGGEAGAIIFSGMAHDAIEGSQYLKSKGGVIWVQDPDTCVVSSMVDGAREAGVVSFIGSPQQLAQKMIADYGKG